MFANRLKKLMAERQMNQVDLAKKSGVAQSLISSYLRGSTKAKFPGLENLIALAQALRCTLEELTGLASLSGIENEAAHAVPTEEEIALIRQYKALPPDHWLKRAIEQVLLQQPEAEMSGRKRKLKT